MASSTAQGAAVPGGGLAAAVCGKLQRQPGHHPARRPGGAGDDGRPRPHPACADNIWLVPFYKKIFIT